MAASASVGAYSLRKGLATAEWYAEWRALKIC